MTVLLGMLLALFFVASSLRKIPVNQRGVVLRLGRIREKAVGPGLVLILPFIDRLTRVSIEPFLVSLPPQSAITKDEIPIQLQASLNANVTIPHLAANVKDWRIYLVSQLQDLMKEQLEELDFDNLDSVFAEWVRSIREQLNQKSGAIGVRITDLQISNLSPRSKPA